MFKYEYDKEMNERYLLHKKKTFLQGIKKYCTIIIYKLKLYMQLYRTFICIMLTI